jgi:hypothetical protein
MQKPSWNNWRACSALPEKLCTTPRGHADAPDRGDHLLDRPSRVQHHRQVVLERQFELALEITALHLGIQSFDVEVQPALADRDAILAREPLRQVVEMLRAMLGQEHRVQPVRRVQARLAPGTIRRAPASRRRISRGTTWAVTPALRGAREHLRAIGSELLHVDVRVGVDQLHGADDNAPWLTPPLPVIGEGEGRTVPASSPARSRAAASSRRPGLEPRELVSCAGSRARPPAS